MYLDVIKSLLSRISFVINKSYHCFCLPAEVHFVIIAIPHSFFHLLQAYMYFLYTYSLKLQG